MLCGLPHPKQGKAWNRGKSQAMQEPLDNKNLKNAPERHDGLNYEPQSSAPCIAPSKFSPDLVYDLRLASDCSDSFYADVSQFSDQLLNEIDLRAGQAVFTYGHYAQSELKEPPRSLGEYSIEFLTLGMALKLYAGAACTTPGWVVRGVSWTFPVAPTKGAHEACGRLPARVDDPAFLLPNIRRKAAGPISADQLPRLVEWLEATGEFEQEIARLSHWNSYLGTPPQSEAGECIESAISLFDWFQQEADRALGAYTQRVPKFLSGEYAARPCREDQIFCGKLPVEYHLNMVAAEIMNRGLRPEFESKMERVVLVPGCMRGPYETFCRAPATGTDMQCAGCSPGCKVNRITRLMRSLGAEVYLIQHSSGFSRWLERWLRSPEVSVIAVACMLNILPGGYEMRARRIASQCVPLDYPGCQRHWHEEGIATSLNEDRLV